MVPELSDLALFTRWRDGDVRAGNELLSRHFTCLHRFFTNKAQGHVEDLIQQTFVACVEAKDAYRGAASFRTYLLSLARHTLYQHYRKQRRSRTLDFTTTSVMDLGRSPSGHAAIQDERQLLSRALQHIPIEQQIALELTYWEEMSASEVALVLGIPENTVSSRLRRAKVHLRKALEALSDSHQTTERALLTLGP